MWNQSAIGGFLQPASARIDRRPGGAVGERGHLGVGGSADRLKAAPDQRCDLRLGLRHSAEHLPTTARCLDVADANLQMPFAVLAAADECQVYGDVDCRRSGRRPDRGSVAKLLASP
jgi:hypothetical protein